MNGVMRTLLVVLAVLGLLAGPVAARPAACPHGVAAAMMGMNATTTSAATSRPRCDPGHGTKASKGGAHACAQACALACALVADMPVKSTAMAPLATAAGPPIARGARLEARTPNPLERPPRSIA